mmetsp:Transcript_99201/g.258625  ORF Transcript_99201/g.258625 Transcript_99201/m.258625 type:complete len:306 (+) Transcript_99201:381-1298(+)
MCDSIRIRSFRSCRDSGQSQESLCGGSNTHSAPSASSSPFAQSPTVCDADSGTAEGPRPKALHSSSVMAAISDWSQAVSSAPSGFGPRSSCASFACAAIKSWSSLCKMFRPSFWDNFCEKIEMLLISSCAALLPPAPSRSSTRMFFLACISARFSGAADERPQVAASAASLGSSCSVALPPMASVAPASAQNSTICSRGTTSGAAGGGPGGGADALGARGEAPGPARGVCGCLRGASDRLRVFGTGRTPIANGGKSSAARPGTRQFSSALQLESQMLTAAPAWPERQPASPARPRGCWRHGAPRR